MGCSVDALTRQSVATDCNLVLQSRLQCGFQYGLLPALQYRFQSVLQCG